MPATPSVAAGPPTVDDIADLLGRYRISGLHEDKVQKDIAAIFDQHDITHTREARLSARDRIDFLVGNVGVEVKTQGSLPALLRQLSRYATHENVTSLLLVTATPRLLVGLPDTIGGVPLCALLTRGHLA